jgi:ankyrin repeat protein
MRRSQIVKTLLMLSALVTLSGSSCPGTGEVPNPSQPEPPSKTLEEKLQEARAPDETLLLTAIRLGAAAKPKDSTMACTIAARKLDLDAKDPKSGKTPIALAFDNGMGTAVLCLAENGASVADKVFEGEQPLVWTLKKAAGENPNDPFKDPKNKRIKQVTAFVQAGGAKLQSTIDGESLLKWALDKKWYALAKKLLEGGADPNWAGTKPDLEAPAFAALESKDPELFALVVKDPRANLSVKQSQDGQTLLHLAQRNKDFSAVRLLVSTGADVSLRDNKGRVANFYQAFDWSAWDVMHDEAKVRDPLTRLETCKEIFDRERVIAGDDLTRLSQRLQTSINERSKQKYIRHISRVLNQIQLQIHDDKASSKCANLEGDAIGRCKQELKNKDEVIKICQHSLEATATCALFFRAGSSALNNCLKECHKPCGDKQASAHKAAVTDALPSCMEKFAGKSNAELCESVASDDLSERLKCLGSYVGNTDRERCHKVADDMKNTADKYYHNCIAECR